MVCKAPPYHPLQFPAEDIHAQIRSTGFIPMPIPTHIKSAMDSDTNHILALDLYVSDPWTGTKSFRTLEGWFVTRSYLDPSGTATFTQIALAMNDDARFIQWLGWGFTKHFWKELEGDWKDAYWWF